MAQDSVIAQLQERLEGCDPNARTRPGSPEATAMAALLVVLVADTTVRARVANAETLEEIATWIAVDQLLPFLSSRRKVAAISARKSAAGALREVVARIGDERPCHSP